MVDRIPHARKRRQLPVILSGDDSDRMLIRVEQGKGGGDRYIMLSPQLLVMRHHPLGAGGPRLVDSAPNLRMTNRLMLQRELGPGSTQWLQSTESVLTALRDSENQQIRHFSAARSVGVDRGLVSSP
jgi:hypothetical protein